MDKRYPTLKYIVETMPWHAKRSFGKTFPMSNLVMLNSSPGNKLPGT